MGNLMPVTLKGQPLEIFVQSCFHLKQTHWAADSPAKISYFSQNFKKYLNLKLIPCSW
jgi:hypothetical protein